MLSAPATPISDAPQGALFGDAPAWPPGLVYQPELITLAEERALLERIAELEFVSARYREWTARRRVARFGGQFDFSRNVLVEADPAPAFLCTLREKIGAWCGVAPEDFRHVLVSEYAPGTPLGWHRDAPSFETVAGLSLAGECRMRWRPWSSAPNGRAALTLDLAPRSAYVMRGPSRWDWQHAISPTKMLRYSITFRTLRS
jgi:alkylated DNA repair dioxygenase AlkB